jgi:heavy metal translocating P-type ATPase
VQRLADRLSAYLVYAAFIAACLTFLGTRDLRATISVVIVAGACGVAAGTPLAVLAAIARSARHGAFIKDGAHVEQMSRVETVMFDKTGTLTLGKPQVTGIRPAQGVQADVLLAYAAAVEALSEHPLGQAIVAYARERGIAIQATSDFVYTPGVGVEATVDGGRVTAGRAVHRDDAAMASQARSQAVTSIDVTVDGRWLGAIDLADAVRPSAASAVSRLRDLGVRMVMVTGDAQAAASAVGAQVGLDDARGGLLPTQKLAAIRAERATGRHVVMVGDGVNDAPALAEATVGIAMGSGTEVARHSADIVLISSDLDDVAAVLMTARRARRIIWFNFAGTLIVDAIGMALAATGIIGPTLAAIIHVTSESAFILNSTRLLPRLRGGGARESRRRRV